MVLIIYGNNLNSILFFRNLKNKKLLIFLTFNSLKYKFKLFQILKIKIFNFNLFEKTKLNKNSIIFKKIKTTTNIRNIQKQNKNYY